MSRLRWKKGAASCGPEGANGSRTLLSAHAKTGTVSAPRPSSAIPQDPRGPAGAGPSKADRCGDFGETALPVAIPSKAFSSKRPKFSSTAGFSLIEALVALMVFAGVAVIFSQAFFNTLTALDTQKAEATKIDDLRFVRSQVILEPDLETFEDGGEIETLDAGEARWEAEVEETEIPHLFRVDLEIEFEGTQETEGWTHLETLYLLRPTWSDVTESGELMADITERITDERDVWDW